ncbi:unnamed protein product [Symbiodinium necroappetens]|uniref:Uncharacterized protein n=1 Tax=Symbiodinium necroappetens TaxID=1628268 RepID=A0A812RTR8_9DINO|nr:unnamed protein product [Symbiodinium necroappetens]
MQVDLQVVRNPSEDTEKLPKPQPICSCPSSASMAFAVAQRAGYGRSGSRSPRLQKQVEVEADHGGPDGLPCDFKGGFNAQMLMQRDFLAQFLVPEQPHAAKSPNAPREAAAGLPVEAAKVLMLGPGPGRVPWLGLPAGVACVAATLQLFSRLLPGSVAEGMCDELCKQATADPSMPVELDALATRVGLVSCPVPSAVPSLQGGCGESMLTMIACYFMTFWLTSFARSLSRWFFCRWLLSALLNIDDPVADLQEKEKATISCHPRENRFEESCHPSIKA